MERDVSVGCQDTHLFPVPAIQVAPVTILPDRAVNTASQELVQAHSTKFPTKRIVMRYEELWEIKWAANVPRKYKLRETIHAVR